MRDYTVKDPKFSDTIRITEVSDPGNAQLINAASIQLLQNTLVNQEMIRKLEEKTGAAGEFESEGVYKSGDYCLHNGILYKCVQDTEGEWDEESWKPTNTLEEMGATQKKLEEVFYLCNEKKQILVENLVAMGVQASTSETWEELLNKVLDMTDTSSDTVTAAALLAGYTAHNAAGEQITGIIPERVGVTVDATVTTQDDAYTYFGVPEGYYDENSKVRSANSNLHEEIDGAQIKISISGNVNDHTNDSASTSFTVTATLIGDLSDTYSLSNNSKAVQQSTTKHTVTNFSQDFIVTFNAQ